MMAGRRLQLCRMLERMNSFPELSRLLGLSDASVIKSDGSLSHISFAEKEHDNEQHE